MTAANITVRIIRPSRLRVVISCASLVLAAGLLNGCARGVAVTTVNPNGSWTRKITFHGVKPDKNGGKMGQKIEDAFVLPTGAEWKITRHDENDESSVVLERVLMPGQTLNGDITIKSGKKGAAPVMVNTVRVQQTALGVFRYTETLHWKGEPVKELTPDADAIAVVKKSLPALLATDVNAREVATRAARVFWRVLFGPGDPLLAELSAAVMQPEMMERKILRRTASDMDRILADKFGAQMNGEQRLTVTRRIVAASLNTVSTKSKSNAPGSPPQDQNGKDQNGNEQYNAVALTLSVKMPGHITQTNGERDDLNGDVYWSLYPQAAATGDVSLSATCDTNKATNK